MSEDPTLSSRALGLERTLMAADRTLMAWTRTGLSLISFGFTLFKFLQYTLEKAQVRLAGKLEGPRQVGMAMISLGIIFLVLACIQFWRDVRRLRPRHRRFSPLRLSLAMAVLLSLIGVLALVHVVFRAGSF